MKYNEQGYTSEGSASHYNERINTIHKMEAIWGTEAVMIHCEMNVFKYRQRLGKKVGTYVEEELVKIAWYERAAKYYFKKMLSEANILPFEDASKQVGVPKEIDSSIL